MTTSRFGLLGRSFLVMLGLVISSTAAAKCTGLMDYEARKLRSKQTVDFCEAFDAKVLLVVNTASSCGYTPQFKELESLYQKYKDRGLEIVGFPSNDFDQEYGDEEKTAEMCFINYGVTFTMVSTSSVKGPSANSFFKRLSELSGKQPSWNFNKYLVSADGSRVNHYASTTTPLNSELEQDISKLLP